MKKGITLLTIILSVLHSYAQENWNAVKVFELNTDDIYNFYIDTIGTEDGKVDFCFQTSDYKLIKTDAQGNIIDVTDSPYHYYTIFNGDTIIIDDGYVINVSKGDTIYFI